MDASEDDSNAKILIDFPVWIGWHLQVHSVKQPQNAENSAVGQFSSEQCVYVCAFYETTKINQSKV